MIRLKPGQNSEVSVTDVSSVAPQLDVDPPQLWSARNWIWNRFGNITKLGTVQLLKKDNDRHMVGLQFYQNCTNIESIFIGHWLIESCPFFFSSSSAEKTGFNVFFTKIFVENLYKITRGGGEWLISSRPIRDSSRASYPQTWPTHAKYPSHPPSHPPPLCTSASLPFESD